MTSEINPSSIRELRHRKTEFPHEDYVIFVAKGNDKRDFWVYTSKPTKDSGTIQGPEFDVLDGVFIKSNLGQWEKSPLGCSGIIKYYLSPKVKSETPQDHEARLAEERSRRWKDKSPFHTNDLS